MENRMENYVQNLTDVLEQELELYSTLLKLLSREKQALLQMKIDDVYYFAKEKEEILFDIEAIEIERNKVLGELGETTGLLPKDISITRLLGVIPDMYSHKLKTIQSNMKKLFKDIDEANAINRILVEKTDKFLTGCIKLITTICTPVTSYMPNGEVHAEMGSVGGLICERG